MIIIIAISAFLATFLGGMFAIRFKDKLHLVTGFSAGAIIAVAFFDLIPEAIELGQNSFDVSKILSFTALGFALFMILDRFVIMHSHHNDERPIPNPSQREENGIPLSLGEGAGGEVRGKLGAGSLSIHSFLDGIAIGLAFQVNPAVGAVVTTAVLVHDFSDGINTVNLIFKNGGDKKEAMKWLGTDAIAPVLGIIATMFFTLPESVLGIMLATFAGFFLYIGASDLLPESHHAHPTIWTTIATILGMTVLFVAIKLAGI